MITLEAAFQEFFFIIVIHCRYAWGIPVGVSFPVKLAGCMSAVLVEGGSFVGVPRVFHFIHFLLCEQLFFWENCPWCLLQYFKYTFYLIFHGRKVSWGALFGGLMFGKCLVLNQSFVKRQLCVGNIERFPS